MLSVDDFLIRRQLLKSERGVITRLKREARDKLRQAVALNASLQMQRRRACDVARFKPSREAEVEQWNAPAPRVARAYRLWHDEGFEDDPLQAPPSCLRIGMIVGGGVGDQLKASVVIPTLTERLDLDLYYITDNRAAIEIFRHSPYVNHILITRRNPHELMEEAIRHLPLFDLIVTWKYAVEFAVPRCSRLPPEMATALIARSDKLSEEFRRYNYCNEIWPKFNQAFGRAMVSRGLRAVDVGSFTVSGGTSSPNALAFFPNSRSLNVANALSPRPYVTVHHGFDLNHLPEKLLATNYGSTKNIPISLWAEIVAAIQAAGIDVVQLGALNEEVIPGVSRSLNGQTTLSETALILKKAICHIDTEGGLVHLARAVHTKSVVLFGPTPVAVFGYPQNINIEPVRCKGCWFTAVNWIVQCPRLTAGPQCVEEHRPGRVIGAINEILHGVRNVAVDLVDKIAVPQGATIPGLLSQDRTKMHLSTLSTKDAVIISEQTASLPPPDGSLGQDFAVSVLVASDVPGHEIAVRSLPERLRLSGIPLASIFNIPRESSSLDLIVCHSAAWSSEYGPDVLWEMVRVLRPGGILILWHHSTSNDDVIDIGRLAAGAGLNYHDKVLDLPPGEALAFVLRKELLGRRFSDGLIHAERSAIATPPIKCDVVPVQDKTLGDELEAIAAGNEEYIFDTYRDYVQRNHVEDQIWANRSAIHHSATESGWISMSSDFCEGYADSFAMEGWHALETWGVWGAGRKHTLMLPLPNADNREEDILLEATIALPSMDLVPQQSINVVVDGEILDVWTLGASPETRRVRIPARLARPVLEVEFHVAVCVVPSRRGLNKDDHREIGIGLHQFRYGCMAGDPDEF